MIPPALLIPPALSWLLAARFAVAYWQASAEVWATLQAMTTSADIVPFPLSPRPPQSKATAGLRNAEIVRFVPGER